MFEVGKLYKHLTSKDIHYHVVAMEQFPTAIFLRVKYWNHFYKTFQGDTDSIIVQNEDVTRWIEV